MSDAFEHYMEKHKKGEVIYQIETAPKHFYYIVKGSIELLRIHENGSSIERTLETGGTFGELEYFSNEKRKTQANVREESILLSIDETNLDAFISAYPQVIMNILKRMSQVLGKTNETLEMTEAQVRRPEGVTGVGQMSIKEAENTYAIEGKKKYPMVLPEGHEVYLYTKEVTCPVCETIFNVSQIRGSQLVLQKVEKDQRRRYKSFDELWYQLWRCPHCGYVNFYNEFFKIRYDVRKQLFENLPRTTTPTEQVLIKNNINEVIEDHLHFNRIIQFYQMDIIVKVRLWQSIAWLLEDVHDKESAFKARRILKALMEESWYNSRVVTQIEDQCKLAIKLASLCKEDGEIEAARKYLLSFSKIKDVPHVYRVAMTDELIELKELAKREKQV